MNKGNKMLYNVGTGTKTSVKELYDRIKKHFPEYTKEPIKKDRRSGELASSVLNGKSLLRDFDKDSYIDMDTGVPKTVNWFKGEHNER